MKAARNAAAAVFIFLLGSVTGPALGVPTVITLGPGEEITIRAAEAPEVSPSTTLTPSETPSATPSPSPSPTPSATPTPTTPSSSSPPPTPASTPTSPATPSATSSQPSPTPTQIPTSSPTPTATPSPTPTPTTTPPPTPTTEYVGFGSVTDGGAGYPVVTVTNTNDNGPGSLRSALSGGGRIVRIETTGTINLKSILYVRSSDVTLEGNGATITGWPIWLQGAHDIILRDFHHRGGAGQSQSSDNITIGQSSARVVLDHLSLSGQGDEAVGIWDRNTDITISNTLIGPGVPNHNYGILIGKQSQRVTVYRNVIIGTEYRNPAVGWDDSSARTVAPSIVADVVNNLVWNTDYGTTVYWGGKANLVGNYYSVGDVSDIGSKGQAYAAGNYIRSGGSLSGNVSSPFSVARPVTVREAVANARAILLTAGCLIGGRDSYDATLLSVVNP